MDSLLPSDSALVDTTAKTCSILGGPAVFKARMLYSLWNVSPNWDDIDLCASNAGQNKNKVTGGSSYTDLGTTTWGIDEDEPAEQARILAFGEVNVYPNPSNGLFNIKYNFSDLITDPILHVFDITGKMLLSITLDKSKNKQIIDLSAFSSGVYTIDIKANSFNYKTKITLLK
jgi:Secretion system C-terminal sorting domain